MYKVLVDDNFHYMDASERYEFGQFESWDSALDAAEGIVDRFLASAYRPGLNADDLYKQYISFGEDPFIIVDSGSDLDYTFSARIYAKARCVQICQRRSSSD